MDALFYLTDSIEFSYMVSFETEAFLSEHVTINTNHALKLESLPPKYEKRRAHNRVSANEQEQRLQRSKTKMNI